MHVIESVANAPGPLRDEARALFREYYAFLQATKSCGAHLPRLDDEIGALPVPYAGQGGEVLVVCVDGSAAACIAYRATAFDSRTCEIKRLFVRTEFRGHGLARKLIVEAMDRAAGSGFTRVILDTDTSTMPAAYALYLKLGFREYRPVDGNLTFLDRAL